MEDWKQNKIIEAIETIKKEEARQFAIVYASLDENTHGYLQELPQKQQVWFEEADKEFLAELKKRYGWDRVSAWNGKTFYETRLPYLGLDGMLQLFNSDYPEGKINVEFMELGSKTVVVATVTAGEKKSMGVVDLEYKIGPDKKIVKDENGKPVFANVEIPVSNAIRKALGYFKYGRFPTHKTEYGDHPLVIKFREFMLNEKNSNV